MSMWVAPAVEVPVLVLTTVCVRMGIQRQDNDPGSKYCHEELVNANGEEADG